MTSGAVALNGHNETFFDISNSGGVFTTGNGLNTNTVNITDPTFAGGTNTISSGTTANFGSLNISGGTNTVQGNAGTGLGGAVLNAGSHSGVNFSGAASPTLTINSDNSSAGQVVLAGDVTSTITAGTATIASGGSAINSGITGSRRHQSHLQCDGESAGRFRADHLDGGAHSGYH